MTTPIIFERWPDLRRHIPWLPLGVRETPVVQIDDDFWVKRDDMLGGGYGGNKVRKLEFSLAEIIQRRKTRVITAGGVGSNHVTATSIYAQRLALDVSAVLVPQPVQKNLRTNLLAMKAHECDLHPVKSEVRGYLMALWLLLSRRRSALLWIGGSSVTGVLGAVNLALEIEEQVASGLVPEPENIVVPVGSTGTLAGLVAGKKLTRLRSNIVGVRAYSDKIANEWMVRHLANRALRRMRLPQRVTKDDVNLMHGYFGHGYAVYTHAAVEAMEHFAGHGMTLEGTYSGKAAAAALDMPGRTLFINTYNSQPMAPLIEGADIEDLPPILREYFEKPVAEVEG